VAVLAPIDSSPFALAVAELARREAGIELAGLLVRRIVSPARLRTEFRRDGVRLLRKVWRQLVVGRGPVEPGERGFHEVVTELGLAGSSLVRLARRHGVAYRKVADFNAPRALAFLRAVRPDLAVFTGGGLVRRPLLEACGRALLNPHMGILPAYRGIDVVEWPFLEGRQAHPELGITLHLIDPGIDTGPIVTSRRVPIQRGDTLERLRTRYEPVMVDLLLEGIRLGRDGRLAPTPQDPAAGRQYFALHPRLYAEARRRLARLAASA
jgi:folate-dependent phosphoribosylglycinamide formyltransferase PurN